MPRGLTGEARRGIIEALKDKAGRHVDGIDACPEGSLRVREAYGAPKHDPWALAPFIFSATQRLGVIPTINPAAMHPYTAARMTASLHHLSQERLGLNIVTDVGSAAHFGQQPLDHDAAYDRASEWTDLVRQLWSSWAEDALVEDVDTGIFADGTRIHPVQHHGTYYRSTGPLNAVPFETSSPVIASPGGSPRGLAFAGEHSDIQLALAPLNPTAMATHQNKVRAAAAAAGRESQAPKTLFVFKPLIVSTQAEADYLVEESRRPSDESLYRAAAGWSSDLETDLTALPLDEPLPEGIFGDHVSRGSIKAFTGGVDSTDTVSLREILTAKAQLGRVGDGIAGTVGAPTVGTASEVADLIEELGAEARIDGLLFSGDFHPTTVHRTLDGLVPELRRRGILAQAQGPTALKPRLQGD